MLSDRLRSACQSGTHMPIRSNKSSGWGRYMYCPRPDRSYFPGKHKHLKYSGLYFLDRYNKMNRLRQAFPADKYILHPNRFGFRRICKYIRRPIDHNKDRMQSRSTSGLVEWRQKQSLSCFHRKYIRKCRLLAKVVR